MKTINRNNIFYSEDYFLIHTTDSLISNDRIFVGNQTDDFGGAALLNNVKNILLLGGGYGGAIRPLLCNGANLTIVDNNEYVLKFTEKLFSEKFNELSELLNFVNDDAEHYLERVQDRFDAICIDLYSHEGYAECIFNESFWKNINRVLMPHGTIFFNSWGLPQQLKPLINSDIQIEIASKLLDNFNYVSYLPHRRNITFVARNNRHLDIQYNLKWDQLNQIDESIINFLPYRLLNSINITKDDLSAILPSKEFSSFVAINNDMFLHWKDLLQLCSEVSSELNISQQKDLMEIINNPEDAKKITNYLLKFMKEESTLIPIMVGAASFENRHDLSWFTNWMIKDSFYYLNLYKSWYINTALWQMFAIFANPFCSDKYWNPKVNDILNNLRMNRNI